MNEVFIIAKVIEKVRFQFIYHSYKTAIAQVEVELLNKSKITYTQEKSITRLNGN